MIKKTVWVMISLLMVLSLVIASCGPKEEEKPNITEEGGQTIAPTYGGLLKIATSRDARTPGDPVGETSQDGKYMMGSAVEFLGRIDANGISQPWLAESWQASSDATSFTLELKSNIKFHDGTDLNASVVKWLWEHYIATKSEWTSTVKSVEVIDNDTVRANLLTQDIGAMFKLTYHAGKIVSSTAFEKNGAQWAEKNPIGTGPFQFVSWVPEVSMKFEKFDEYWQEGKPYLDGVEFVVITDQVTRLAAFKAGEIDVMTGVPAEQAKDLEKEGKYKIIVISKGGELFETGLTYDSGNPDSVFANLKVRQAIAYAIDRDLIVNTLSYGYATATNQWGHPEDWAFNPDIKGYPYDPDKARKLLAEAGYPEGFSTKYNVISGNLDVVQAVQKMLADVGIKTELKIHELPGWRDMITKGWKNELLAYMGPSDGDVTARMSWFKSDSWAYVSWLRSEEIDRMVDEAISSPNFELKKARTWELQRWAFEDQLIFVPFSLSSFIGAIYPSVHDSGILKNISDQWSPESCWIER